MPCVTSLNKASPITKLRPQLASRGRTVRRNSPTIYNVGYHQKLFHDARDDRLEHQVWQPLLARNEMANPSVSAVINKLRGLADYAGLFERAFAGAPVSMRSIGMAIASYERTLVSANSPFDRWHYAGEESALGDSAKRGFDVFTGQGRCTACHLVGDKTALFTDHKLHNTGIGFRHSMKTRGGRTSACPRCPGHLHRRGSGGRKRFRRATAGRPRLLRNYARSS